MGATLKTISFATALLLACATVSIPAVAWTNGQTGNTGTNTATECSNPPYSTHDWIADHALALLPTEEKAWLVPHRALYLIGTEAPDNQNIRLACGVPHRGYDDRSQGHSVQWNASVTQMITDRPAVRAQEEYDKAVVAFRQGKLGHAAFFLGAMAHYIGDVSQYGHNYRNETFHGEYETWAAGLTPAFNGGTFESAVSLDSLVRRSPYTATRRVSRVAFAGDEDILRATQMDTLFSTKPPAFMTSVGASLNLGVNEVADVLHTFFLNVVSEEDE
jgi:hypothetical protein